MSDRTPHQPGDPEIVDLDAEARDDEALAPGELDALSRLLGDATVWDEPPAALEDAVLAAIAAEAATAGPSGPAPGASAFLAVIATEDETRGSAPAGASAAAPTGAAADNGPASPTDALSARRRRRSDGSRRGLSLALGATAAAVLLIAVVTLVAVRGGGRTEGRELALNPTPLAPAASGQIHAADLSDGVRIVLDVSGLPPAPPGTYYEAWVRKSPEIGVSAGSFHLRGGGHSSIELWAGVPVEEYPLFTITLQEEGKGAASSGKVVLSGRFT
jgi:hypothetical protein